MECSCSIRFVVALEAEAEPIIEDYDLKIIHEINLFKVYRNNSGNHWLIISGIGSINAAAASIFLYQHSNANKSSFWFNIGIAGYFTGPAGEIFLVDKILDEATCQTHFPSVAQRFIHSFQINPSDDSVFLQDWFIQLFFEIRYET